MEQVYRGQLGQHVSSAAAEACRMADQSASPVVLDFNNVRVPVHPGQGPDAVMSDWQAGMEAIAEAYRASPAGQRAAMDAQDRLDAAQVQHDKAMATLPVTFPDARAAIQWLQSFSDAADHSGIVGADFGHVADVLEASGWRDSEACDLPSVEYQKPDVLGRWIIGQAIDMLRKGLPPHHVLMGKFAPEYLAAV